MHAADPEIGCVHARAGGALVETPSAFRALQSPQAAGFSAPTSIACVVTLSRCDRMRPISQLKHADQLPAACTRCEQLLRRQTERVLLIIGAT